MRIRLGVYRFGTYSFCFALQRNCQDIGSSPSLKVSNSPPLEKVPPT